MDQCTSVEIDTDEPVDDKDTKGHYEKYILAHMGARLIGEFQPSF